MTREAKVFGIDFYVNEEDGVYAKVVAKQEDMENFEEAMGINLVDAFTSLEFKVGVEELIGVIANKMAEGVEDDE